MLSRLYYVTCDTCGMFASDGEMDAEEAHRVARELRWRHLSKTASGTGRPTDTCCKCFRAESVNP
jgi:hypothetical protein